jgi:hypothetical protein
VLTKRKVYIVPMIQPSPQAPDGFDERFKAYWQAVDQQVSGLESRAGVVGRVFAEGVLGKGDDALLMLQQTNPDAHRVVKARVDAGARFDSYEDDELFGEIVDWGRCLSVPFVTQGVASAVSASYQDAAARRQRHLETRLQEGIEDGEALLLLSGSSDVQFPPDIERFVVAPPELDQLERWVRATNEAIRKEAEQAAARGEQPGQRPPAQSSGQADQGGTTSGSGLWTPGN